MKRFLFLVTAHERENVDTYNEVTLYSKIYDYNPTDLEYVPTDSDNAPYFLPVRHLASRITDKWQLDDGEDYVGTTYCQYVHYPDPDDNRYLLAALYALDEYDCIVR